MAPVSKVFSGSRRTDVISFWLLFASVLLHSVSSKIIDLTHELESGIPVQPGVQAFNFTDIITRDEPFWFAIDNFCMSEQTGTHFDAPYHFNKEGWKVEEVPIERLVAPAVLVTIVDNDVSGPETRYDLTVDDLVTWEKEYGRIPDNSVVFLFTGWDKYWNDINKYIFNNNEKDWESIKTPGFTHDVIEWLFHNRNVVGIGIDSYTVEVGFSPEYPVHRAASTANYYILEDVTGLSQLPPVGATVYVSPILIKNGAGAPVRLLASVPDDEAPEGW